MTTNKICEKCIYKTKLKSRLNCSVAIREGDKTTKISEMKKCPGLQW